MTGEPTSAAKLREEVRNFGRELWAEIEPKLLRFLRWLNDKLS